MWKRKDLKNKAKKVVKKNYWTAIVVCFLIALFTGEFGTSILGIWQSDDSFAPELVKNEINIFNVKIPIKLQINSKELPFNKEISEVINNMPNMIFKAIEANLNSATKSQKYLFRIWDAVKSFNIHESKLGIFLCIVAVVALAFTIFVADPLIVGGKRYFLKARVNNSTKVGELLEIFKANNWTNIVKIMFLRNLYNALWYLTIVGGVIKTYEYRMIPYILAEEPTKDKKEAFELSKQMMKGNKWRTFILDMSFFGWNLLSVLTFGLVSIFYVNPYNSATIAELYASLKENNNN